MIHHQTSLISKCVLKKMLAFCLSSFCLSLSRPAAVQSPSHTPRNRKGSQYDQHGDFSSTNH